MEPRFLLKIAEKFGTPLYVYDEDQIRKNYRTFLSAFKSKYKNTKIFYAYKANSSLAICHMLRQEGAGADVVSECELITARRVGIKPMNIIFTGNGKTDRELQTAVDSDVIINVDSMDELYRLHKIAKGKRKSAKISFRINPSIDARTHPKIATGLRESKFGIHLENDLAFKAYRLAKELEWIEILGIHTHIGSQITDVKPFKETAEKIMQFVCELKEKLEIKLRFIDLGGGLGISYRRESAPSPESLAEAIVPVIRRFNARMGYDPELWLEPGRYIVGNAGVLLCKVTGVKETPYKKFVSVDTGFNALMRPAMYNSYHSVRVLNKSEEESTEIYDIAGNICESGDILAKERKLPKVECGDIIAILDVGAYGFSMSSQYNLRPRPSEVLVWGETVEVIRERETCEDFFEKQYVPKDLLE
ncbi:MAG: diaminopimelate decarboxylase [Candidatus Altiarchaeales archaeon]|nr:MAG: diaminopimelate decarboxylase [Candidatus Altiarchaeales archaeon]